MNSDDVFDPSDWPKFILLDVFDEEWSANQLDDHALNVLQLNIKANPVRYPVIPGTQGLRKIRLADPGSNRGKSGSYRVGYVSFPDHGVILLVTVWGKNEKSNLTKADRNAIAALILRFKALLDRGPI